MLRLKRKTPGMYKVTSKRSGVINWRWSSLQTGNAATGYYIRTMSLDNQEDTPEGSVARMAQAQALQQELRAWIDAMVPKQKVPFLGTVNSLIDVYEKHIKSPIQKVAPNTRKDYLYLIGRIRRLGSDKPLAKVGGLDFLKWFDDLAGDIEPRKIRLASASMNMWRMIVSWGVVLELPGSLRLQTILSNMRFQCAKPRTSFLTFDHAAGVIKSAWDAERPSIALAQALQFECALRQVDVIGAWFPLDKRNPSRIYNHEQTEMWVNGITWEDIDGDWILNKRISKTGSYLRIDLKLAPLVVEQMQRMYSGRHLSGPIIVSEITRLPYRKDAFREMWRKFARKAGVPSAVFNMDSRSGGITEATDAGSSLEEVRHLAQHKSPAMTARYSRNTLSKTRGTATARIELRGGN